MSTRVGLTVGVVAIVLLSGVGPVVGTNTADNPAANTADNPAANTADNPAANATDGATSAGQGYEVSLNNVTVETWLLRDSRVRNATVQEVVVENVTTPDGARENVTLTNVTVGDFVVERGRLLNVTATKLVVRNKSVLDVPGGEFIDPNLEGRTIEREWTKNATVAGVVIDRMTIDAAILCENASLGEEADDPAAFDPLAADDDPAITVQNGTAQEALIIRGHASDWSVESVEQPDITNVSLPQRCGRGDAGDGGGGQNGGGGDGEQDGGNGDGQ